MCRSATSVELCLLATLCLTLGGPLVAGGPAALAESDPDQVIYRYVHRGRPVFVNGLERVPPRFRAQARAIDLSRVSLNTDLGRALHDEVEREVQRLQARHERGEAGATATMCAEAQEPGMAGWLKWLWSDHGALVLIAGALLALGIATPFVVRYVPADRWVRVLMVAIPLLGSLGAITVAGVRTSRVLRELRGECRQPSSTMEELGPLRELRAVLRKRQERERAPHRP